jgi:hypothetical protein
MVENTPAWENKNASSNNFALTLPGSDADNPAGGEPVCIRRQKTNTQQK